MPRWPHGRLDRVIVDADGLGVTPRRAELNGILPTDIFVRNDGWTLGAPYPLSSIARRMYEGHWREYWRRAETGRWIRMWPECEDHIFDPALSICTVCGTTMIEVEIALDGRVVPDDPPTPGQTRTRAIVVEKRSTET